MDKFYLKQAFYEVLLLNFTQIFYGMNIKLKYLIISGLILFIIPFSFAQKTIYYTDNSLLFKKAQELYSKRDFSNAYQLFENYIQLKNKDALLSIDAEYFKAMCAYYLENKDAEMQLLQFVNHYPENTRVNDALFHLANLYYKKKKYDDVLTIYQKIEIDNLSIEE